MINLNPEQHDFFNQIASLAFANPFSMERETADCSLLNIASNSLDIFQRSEKIQLLLTYKLRELQPIDEFKITDFPSKTHETMMFSWLFYQFHEFQTEFNQFIDDQSQAGDEPIQLPFSQSIIQRFQKAEFTNQQTEKFIALFYQLHRGFYFISSTISGNCPAIIQLRMRLWNNIFTFNPKWYLKYLCGKMEDFSTLLLGQTGTGKSLAAYCIGCSGFIPFDQSKQRFVESFTRSFQSINLSQYPASLLESELFGHKKGAFTGAIEQHQGLFARCSAHGSVFIDEIGDIDIPTQVKLLNVIQDRTFSPVGSHEKIRFSGRVISATNWDINQLRKEKLFRDDLYYRLCSDVIDVPSLHQRLQENPQELTSLIESLLKRIIDQPDSSQVSMIENKIRSSVNSRYTWPGNVRELEQCIRRICLTGQYTTVNENSQNDQQNGFCISENNGEMNAQQLMQRYCRYLYDDHGSYEAVARITHLDRRTVKKYIVD